MSFNFKKLIETMHYVCEKAGSTPLDPIKLNKILWYSDCMSYLQRGYSITGSTYIRKQHGPVPRAHLAAIDELERRGSVQRGHISRDQKFERCLDVTAEADKSRFTGAELAIIDKVFKLITPLGSMAISERTHGDIWEMADMDEPLPLFTVFAEQLAPVTDEHMKMAMANLG